MAMVGPRPEPIYTRYAIVDQLPLQAARLAAFAEGKVLGKVKGAKELAPS